MKVLVVDDMVEGRTFIEELVRFMGHEAAIAENGRRALDILRTEDFDLVISDILMPVMDGYQLCRAIKTDDNLRRVPVMFLTATYTEDQDQELAERIGADLLVRKPVETQKLMDMINGLLSDATGETASVHHEPDGEKEILDLYSKRLIHQLEKKMVELEEEVQARRKKEEELLRSRQQLRDLSAHLQDVRERERAYLAREIHDELGQAFTALRMDAIYIRDKAVRNLITQRVDSMIEFIDKTADTVQRICSDLRPSILDDLGLSAAMEWLVSEFQMRSEDTRFELVFNDSEIKLREDLSTTTFRILQEALTNIVKHAGAENVKIKFFFDNGDLNLTVSDDGKGITAKDLEKPDSFGLLGMKERALNVQGSLDICSEPGKGSEIRLTVPMEGSNDADTSSDR